MIKINWNTRIDRIGRKQAVRIAEMTLRWCRTNMGVNRRRKYEPTWYICRNTEDDNLGYYYPADHEIRIHWDKCPNVAELVCTCIHEWTHQLQPMHGYPYGLAYEDNPFEQEAVLNETLYAGRCWYDIRKKINNGRPNTKTKGV